MLFDTRQAAQTYGLSESWLEKLRIDGNGPKFAKLGRKVMYRKCDFDHWIEARLRASTKDVGSDDQGGAA